ncbi:UDP-glycosyltransferase UGT5-like [Macrosteles quadrilineatus]|uniref:UDP-glycosyltransferase UGT5-like n=1 Tax=Macrosteles quadrilineatus TaxID=74068 RepID=UPI0023E28CBA|nr:UDP-glycosyltransferase UGT5-like [Macrosteles quadrilineatus]
MHWLTGCVVLWASLTGVFGARILAVLPFPGKSHFIFSSAIIRALTERGHEVVEYGPFPPAKPIPNYTHVEIHTAFEEILKNWSYETFIYLTQKDQPTFGVGFSAVWEMTNQICEQTFQHENIKRLLNSKEHFDLVITESTFGQESMLVFGHKFNAPTITVQGFGLSCLINRVAGNSLPIASIPDFATTAMTQPMTFKERANNLMGVTLALYQFYNYHLPNHQKIINKYYPGDAPCVQQLVTNVSLYFTNSHPGVEYTQPYTPNIVPVAGITLTEDRSPLPQIVLVMHWLTGCVVLWASLTGVFGARILAVLPFPGKSHFIFSSAIIRALTERGHEVVEYGPFPPAKPIPNYTHVEIHTAFEEILKNWSYETFIYLTQKDQPTFGVGFSAVWEMTNQICEQTFQHENIKRLLNSKEHFDLVITESTFGQESMLVFGHKFNAPTITVQGFGLSCLINRVAGNSLPIASIPDFATTAMTQPMTFKERANNLMGVTLALYQFYNYHLPNHQKIINKYYPGDAPCVQQLVTNVSLYFTNSHPGVEYTQPYTPNIVPVAGITLTEDRSPLPQDIQKFMDGAKEGVIYFSFGTVVPLHLFPKEVLEKFTNVFKKMKQRVIWKIELDNIPNLPNNVMLKKWVPQPGVLAHPNLALFLTHGGLNSQLEAMNAGVPTIGIPFFGDQLYNIHVNEYYHIGVKVDFKTLSEESLLSAFTKVLNDKRYKQNAQRMSRIFRDRPVSPADSVVFWTEYLTRHAGARHLQPVAAQLPWYQLWLVDIVAAVLAVVVVFYLVIRKVLSLLFGRRTVAKSKKNN